MLNAARMLCLMAGTTVLPAAESDTQWRSLFNGKDLSGWDTYLAPPPGGKTPLGLNNDPRGVFTVTETDGAPAIHVSGEIYGAITTKDEFDNVHLRVEYKWGGKKWPPRAGPRHYRDSGILYCCIGKANPDEEVLRAVVDNAFAGLS